MTIILNPDIEIFQKNHLLLSILLPKHVAVKSMERFSKNPETLGAHGFGLEVSQSTKHP